MKITAVSCISGELFFKYVYIIKEDHAHTMDGFLEFSICFPVSISTHTVSQESEKEETAIDCDK